LSSKLILLKVIVEILKITFFWSCTYMKSLEKRKKDFDFPQQKK